MRFLKPTGVNIIIVAFLMIVCFYFIREYFETTLSFYVSVFLLILIAIVGISRIIYWQHRINTQKNPKEIAKEEKNLQKLLFGLIPILGFVLLILMAALGLFH